MDSELIESSTHPDMSEKELRSRLRKLVAPHVRSFDFFLAQGKDNAVALIEPVCITRPDNNEELTIKVTGINISQPFVTGRTDKLLPSMCREGESTYNAQCSAVLTLTSSSSKVPMELQVNLGRIPIMVGSSKCWTSTMTRQELCAAREDDNEVGGYFVVKGLERCVRMLIYQRPNHPIVITRSSWQNKGVNYSKYGCIIRCLRNDLTAQTITLHYLSDGQVTLRFIFRRQEFFIPIVTLMKAITGWTDREIYYKIVANELDNTNLTEAAEMLIRSNPSSQSLPSQSHARAFIGSRFRVTFGYGNSISDEEVTTRIIQNFILVHLDSFEDKGQMLIFMMRKLFSLVHGEIQEDNVDSPMFHSVLMPGQLYLSIFKDNLASYLANCRISVLKDVRERPQKVSFTNLAYLKSKMEGQISDIGAKMEYFLATGNHNSKTGLDLMQVTGFTVIADRLNYMRFFSHFQSIHRGSFYTEMKTTAIRKLQPEAWGFLCPVHTPDGGPCGLLNHLAISCEVVTDQTSKTVVEQIASLVLALGVSPIKGPVQPAKYMPVLLNGKVLGYVAQEEAPKIVSTLRAAKVSGSYVPRHLEIAYTDGSYGNGFPAVYLSTDMTRFIRPVLHIPTKKVEYIGILEQVFMDIECVTEGSAPSQLVGAQHKELTASNMLNVIANLTPFSDMNQSPRNMYQCQMGKHAMGTPSHNPQSRVDNKSLRLVYPQTALVRTLHQEPYAYNLYPTGVNAIVAVLSYTGYDMEDALILNKNSMERGFMHGTMYKTYSVDLDGDRSTTDPANCIRAGPGVDLEESQLDKDGLPVPGHLIPQKKPLYCLYNETTGKSSIKTSKGENGFIDQVRIIGNTTAPRLRHATIKIRYNRNPVIGDKFASRHGQKGVMSQLWPGSDMPFTDGGMVPDIIFNPHGFPSRMTIGMLVEFLAGKASALHAQPMDATPFRFDDKHTAVDYFGQQLKKAGYNYYGNEVLYSGVTGRTFNADIFFGVVHYQRLVHQVKDKFQVRSLGPVNELTQQPVHGRKVGGGIRFGEMERDSLLGHGTSMLLHDRLQSCSDRSLHYVCKKCGSLNSCWQTQHGVRCKLCNGGQPVPVAVPFVLRYLTAELAAMNIRLSISVNE
eukprot:TRINITY_DN16007_c0_g1_i1.p1 TRINITY_DN16007_c0_g1~~TRINITY_DN16007_c0_g1_i1.p1  ORF type:complete len:1125 (+),score=243.20 TRINITY_DN16007_c0_g1_i1:22-3375(+)